MQHARQLPSLTSRTRWLIRGHITFDLSLSATSPEDMNFESFHLLLATRSTSCDHLLAVCTTLRIAVTASFSLRCLIRATSGITTFSLVRRRHDRSVLPVLLEGSRSLAAAMLSKLQQRKRCFAGQLQQIKALPFATLPRPRVYSTCTLFEVRDSSGVVRLGLTLSCS